MQYFGFFLLALFAVGLAAAFLQIAKGKKILAAPFRKTGEAASNPQAADAKGLVSCEGEIRVQQPLMAPCSNRPCVYYEYKLEREYEKSTLTEQGSKTSKHWETITHDKRGAHFAIDDGSGPIGVGVTSDGLEAELEKTHSGAPPGNAGLASAVAGALLGGTRHRATEHIVPATGKLFVMGKLAGGQIVKTDGMMGKLVVSTKGRDGLLKKTNRTKMIGFAVAGVSLVGGVPMSILGEKPATEMCEDAFRDALKTACKAKIDSDAGNTWTWVVQSPGDYAVAVKQPDVKYPIWAQLTITDDSGKTIATDTGVGKGADARVTHGFAKGTYKINVKDTVPGYAAQFAKGGGLSFWVDIKGPTAPSAASSGSAASIATTAAPTASAAATTTTTAKAGSAPAKKK